MALPGDPDAKTEDGEPDPKLSREWHYPKEWMRDGVTERCVHGGPIWEFEFHTQFPNNLERTKIAEDILGWEFDEGGPQLAVGP